jgi:microcystin-dependent protein
MAMKQNFPVIASPIVDSQGNLTVPWRRFFESLWQRTGAANGVTGTPTGGLVAFAGLAVPEGYLQCQGAFVSRADYAALFAVIGEEWGAGDGSTTFQLPDFRGRTVFGAGGIFAFGDYGGNSFVTILKENLPSTGLDVTDPGHNHFLTDPGHVHEGGSIIGGSAGDYISGGGSFGVTQSATTGILLDPAVTGITVAGGDDVPLEILPPFGVVNVLIKT